MKFLQYKLAIILLILFVQLGQAQVELGVHVGVNNSMPTGSEFVNVNNVTSDFGPDVGIIANIPLGSKGLFITTGVGYYQSSFKTKSENPLINKYIGWFFDINGNTYHDFDEPAAEWDDLYYYRDYKLNAFNIPLGLTYKFLGKKLNLYFELGTDFSLLNKGDLVIDIKNESGNSKSPTALFHTPDDSTLSYLEFYEINSAADFAAFGNHEKEELFYKNDLTFGSDEDSYFSNLLVSAYGGIGVYIDLFHGDIYLGAKYHHGLTSISSNNDIDFSRPDGLNRIVASVKYTIDLAL